MEHAKNTQKGQLAGELKKTSLTSIAKRQAEIAQIYKTLELIKNIEDVRWDQKRPPQPFKKFSILRSKGLIFKRMYMYKER